MRARAASRGLLAAPQGGDADREAAARSAEAPGYPALLRLVRVALAALGAMPWCVPIARGLLPLGELGAALDRFFWPMCHRLPDRSIALAGVVMPLCSRCAGLFAGIAAGAILARPRLTMAVWRPLLVGFGALMVLDVVTQDLGLRPIWHAARLGTGFGLGYCMAAAFVAQLARPAR